MKNFFKKAMIALAFASCGNAVAQSRPNILWLVIEDTSPQFIGCYGNKNAKTPNIDRLAEGGLRYINAFSTGTVCSPSRSTIITGVRTFEMGTGNHRSQYTIPHFIKGFPYYLRKAGYYTSNNYKTDYNTSDAKRLVQESWNESSAKAGWWNRKNGQPFFAVFNFNDSHQSRVMTNPYEIYQKQVLDTLPELLHVSDNDFNVPPIFKETPHMRRELARIYNGIALADYNIGKIIDSLEHDGLLESTVIFFYADHGEAMPKGKTNGIDLGHRVPFIVWFPEDFKQLSPTGKSGVVSEDLVSFADLAPTLLNLAGVKPPDYMHGRNFLGAGSQTQNQLFLTSDGSEGAANTTRTITNGNFTYSRAFMPFMPQMYYQKYFDYASILQQMRSDFKNDALNDVQKQIFNAGTSEYLYDLKNDPWQTNNLVTQPAYQTLLKKMRSGLKDSIIKNRDVMFLPAVELKQISKTGTAYEFRQNRDAYPIETIYEVASLSGIKTKMALQSILRFLIHPNKFVRYWAAIALKSYGGDLSSCKQQILMKLEDQYSPVKIIVASVAYDRFLDAKAKNILENALGNVTNENLQLLALQMLIYQKYPEHFAAKAEVVKNTKGISADVKEVAELFLHLTTGEPLNYESFW